MIFKFLTLQLELKLKKQIERYCSGWILVTSQGLLTDIKNGKKLKKVQTNDRSAPRVDAEVKVEKTAGGRDQLLKDIQKGVNLKKVDQK